jgi:DNA-binding MarR family transcriptional regulator
MISVSRNQKRDLFLSTMLAFRGYSSAVDAVNQIVAERMGINRTDHRVLEILARKGPMTAGDLAVDSHLTTGAVTTVLDRLERAGYARRIRDTEDRRRILVEETPEGRETAMQYYGPFMERSFQAMAKYKPEQLEAVHDFMRDATALTIEYGNELRAESDSLGNDTAEVAGRP